MRGNVFEYIETQELIQKLRDKGHGDLVDAFLANENKVYTKKTRLNKSGACRVMGCKPKELEDALEECRVLLESDMGYDE